MKKYNVLVINYFGEIKFESTSRNAKRHLKDNGGEICKIFTNDGRQINECRYSTEFGYYYCEF